MIEVQTAVVEVYPTADAAFSLSPTCVTAPGQPVYFVNLSDNATSYVDFGMERRATWKLHHEHDVAACTSASPPTTNGVVRPRISRKAFWPKKADCWCSPPHSPRALQVHEGSTTARATNDVPFSTQVLRTRNDATKAMVFGSDDERRWTAGQQMENWPPPMSTHGASATLSNGEHAQVGNVDLLAR